MFTVGQMKTAHSKVKTGADFPHYVQEIKKLGLMRYEYSVKDGRTIYYGRNGYKVQSGPNHEPIDIASDSSAKALKHTITVHEQGQSDFATFCREVAEAGIEKWIVDTERLLCTYYDKQGHELFAEPIPQVAYN